LRAIVSTTGRLGLAPHQLDRFVQRHALHRLVVDLDDQVARLDAGPKGRRVLDRRDHLDEAVLGADLDAEAAELALGADLQLLEGLGVEIGEWGSSPESMPLIASVISFLSSTGST
jgi:hypothetical protein